jgi:hypothetical protein
MLNQPQVIGKPTAALQFRQGYGLRASAGDGGLLREINNLKEIMRQGYGLGPAKLCFKPHISSPKEWEGLGGMIIPTTFRQCIGGAISRRDRGD